MSQYKLLPSYTDLTSLPDIHNLPVIFSAGVGGVGPMDDTGFQAVPLCLEMEGLGDCDPGYIFPWEQEGVHSIQEALNSQPSVLPNYQYNPVWETGKFLVEGEEEETLDLSSTSTILSYSSYSPPPVQNARLTILPQRQQSLEHGLEVGPVMASVMASTSLVEEREKRVRARPRPDPLARETERPCRVCGERAGKHSYYGGQVCPSCRAFFRRSVQSGYNATYYCVKEGNCEVTLKTRKNCQYCRYRLCENAGMKTSWVLTEEERKLKFAGKGKKRKDRVSSGSVSQSDSTEVQDPGMMPVLELCESDMADIRNYVNISGCHEHSRVTDMDTQLIRKIIRMIAFRASLDREGQNQLRGVVSSRCHKLFSRLEEFSRLCPSDRSVLLGSNLSLVALLTTASMFPLHMQWTMQLSPLLGELEVEKLDTKLRSLNVTGIDNLHLDYSQFFPVQCSSDQDRERLLRLINNIGSWHQDPTELVLLSLVIFFSADMLDLKDRPTVEQIQIKFVLLLQKYINIRHQSEMEVSRQRFAKAMMMVTLCREMEEIQNTANYSNHLDTLEEL